MSVCDFHHWLNSQLQPWNAFTHNMELINHDLRDKRILEIGATNHMTGRYHMSRHINLSIYWQQRISSFESQDVSDHIPKERI